MYDSINITFLKWQNYRDGEQISGCDGAGIGFGKECEHKRRVWEDSFVMKVLYLDCGDGYIIIYTWDCICICCLETHTWMHVKADKNWTWPVD